MEAAEVLAKQPESLQLRYLAAMQDIANDKTNTIVFPLAGELMGALFDGRIQGR
jgi:hypothetical protein